MLTRFEFLPRYGTNAVPTARICFTGPWVTYQDAQQAIATARAEALRDAADRADKCLAYQGFKTGQYSLREFMREAILSDKQEEGKNG